MAWHWILIIVAGALLLPWIIQWSAVAALERREAWSEGFICRSLRYLVYITGQIRSGKSTFLAAYSNIRTKDLRRKALSRIEFTCLAFPEAPLASAEKEIRRFYGEGIIDSWRIARSLCRKGKPLNRFVRQGYDNRIAAKPSPFIEILSNYVDARLALIRDNYVYYYAKAFHSRVTDNDAMDYDPRMLNIKDSALNEATKGDDVSGDYHIMPYTLIAEDEKKVSGKDATLYQRLVAADTGSDTFLRLIGHMGQESIYYATTNQSFGDDFKRERDLATEILFMEKSVAINPRFMTMALLKLLEKPFRLIMAHRKKRLPEWQLTPFMDLSVPRSALSKIRSWEKRCASKGYVRYRGVIYHNPADFGKKIQDATFATERMDVVVPITYAYGSIETYQFHSVQRQLIAHSRWTLRDEPGKVSDRDLTERILAKRRGAQPDAGADSA